jgi:hypothetical protein
MTVDIWSQALQNSKSYFVGYAVLVENTPRKYFGGPWKINSNPTYKT